MAETTTLVNVLPNTTQSPGIKTSEFLVAGVALPALGLLLILLGTFLIKDPGLQGALIDAGKVLAGGGGIAYALSRGMKKLGDAIGAGGQSAAPVVVLPTPTSAAGSASVISRL